MMMGHFPIVNGTSEKKEGMFLEKENGCFAKKMPGKKNECFWKKRSFLQNIFFFLQKHAVYNSVFSKFKKDPFVHFLPSGPFVEL
jgi:hypothetical protein